MDNRRTRQNPVNRNLPESGSSGGGMPFTNPTPNPSADRSILQDGTLSNVDQVLDENKRVIDALKSASESSNQTDAVSGPAVDPDYNPIDEFSRGNLGIEPDKSSPSSGGFKPTIGSDTANSEQKEKRKRTGVSADAAGSEASTLGGLIRDEREQQLDAIRSRAKDIESTKVSKFNLRGRAKKRVRMFLLGSLLAVMLAVPIGVIGVIPHAIQRWVENRVGEYTTRVTDKLGQKVLSSFIKNRVAVGECKKAYNAAGNLAGEVSCRPRVEERNSRLSQLFNDWHSANMEEKLLAKGINVEYDYTAAQNGQKPYRITINREDSKYKNFTISEGSNPSDLDFLDLSEATGKREASQILRSEMRAVLKEDTKWWQYLKRRNLKAGYLRDLGLPARVFPSKKVAKALDDFDVAKATGKSKFRQYLTKWVVSKGDGRMGLMLELLFSGDSAKGKPSELRKTNKALAAAADKLGVEKVDEIIEKYAGKNLQEMELELFKTLMTKLLGQVGEKIGETATKAIPVVGWIMLAFTIMDMLDMATDGTLQHWISSMNAGAMVDMANFMDSTISEEKKGLVDASSAGDMRLSLINGLGSSRILANLVGYKSPSGKKTDGYNCKPKITFSDMSTIFSATDQIFKQGDPTKGAQTGMSDNEDVCENHRVDYNPLSAFNSLSNFIQEGVGPYEGLSTYTQDCFAKIALPGGQFIPDPPKIPGLGDCPSTQDAYHGLKGGIGWVADKLSFLTDWIAELPPVKWLFGNVTGWVTNATTVLITGQSLAGPQLLNGGMNSQSKSGARILDAWYGGAGSIQNGFAKGSGDGGGLGAIPITPKQAATLNKSIAQDRREELASSSIFERMFDISHADTAISGAIGMAITEGGVDNLINPLANLSVALKATSSTAFAADTSQENCSSENEKGQAVNEFGEICYTYTDEMIDKLTDEDLDKYSDPEFCKSYTSAIDAKRQAAEDGIDESKKDPDGTGTSTEPDYCRAMCTQTDVMGTEFRQDDAICGYEDFTGIVASGSDGGTDGAPVAGALGKCEAADVTRPNQGKPKNDIEVQLVPGTSIDIRADYCMNAKNLVDAATADGVKLDGGGFRTYDEQVELRRQHCGSSYDQIYNISPSSCSPPTARPGTSNHERGLAIDFSNCNSRATACYKWLSTNAARFGFKNLPSESWHWSNNGG